jgi:hypothetical protein
MFTFTNLCGQLAAAEGNLQNASPDCSSRERPCRFFFEPLSLGMMHRWLDGQPAEDWSRHI